MRIFNADGSRLKCAGTHLGVENIFDDNHLTEKNGAFVYTLSGIKLLKLQVVDGKVTYVTVDMGIRVNLYYV